MENKVRELIAKWRKREIGLAEAMALTPGELLNQCADELEAALADPGAGQPQQKRTWHQMQKPQVTGMEPLAKFDARAFVQNYYAEREGSHPSAIFAIHETDIEITQHAYAAGLSASGAQRVTAEMISAADHDPSYLHLSNPLQIAMAKAEIINRLLRAAPAGHALSEVTAEMICKARGWALENLAITSVRDALQAEAERLNALLRASQAGSQPYTEMEIASLSVKPEGNWGLLFPLSAEQWYLQIKDRIPSVLNEHARFCFVAANYEHYCRKFLAQAGSKVSLDLASE